jgi:hypothetical protein
MDALTAYKNLLRELDKFESPTFTISDFNYFFNNSISKYITDNYGDFDVIQKDLDDIKAILHYNETLTWNLNIASLPDDYRHALGVRLILKFVKETVDNNIGDEITVYPKRLTTNRKGYSRQNAYQNADNDYFTYQIAGNNLIADIGDNVEIVEGSIDYIGTPTPVYLNPDKTVDYTDPGNNTPIQFDDYVTLEIITACRRMILENIESPRYQTTAAETELNKRKE